MYERYPLYTNITQNPETWVRLIAHVHQEALAMILYCNGILEEALSGLGIDSLRRSAVALVFSQSVFIVYQVHRGGVLVLREPKIVY